MRKTTFPASGPTDAGADTQATLRPLAYTPAQATQIVPIAESSVRRLVREGKLAARYYGSAVLIDAVSLESFWRSLPSERQVDRECAANRRAA
ncbi:helix-turn-helix domain-containing protein [Nocardia sp. CA-135953]|uniref:helix-turn-helix domain-containing protein n=1 Tax=Nocardia sp. CA-135953 TaxID=3239978 RepID=UPI003D98C01A